MRIIEKDPDAVLRRLEEKYAKLPGVADVSHLDGLRIEYGSWWFNVPGPPPDRVVVGHICVNIINPTCCGFPTGRFGYDLSLWVDS